MIKKLRPGLRCFVFLLLMCVVLSAGCAVKARADRQSGAGTVRVLVIEDAGNLLITGAVGYGTVVLKKSGYNNITLNGKPVRLPLHLRPKKKFININKKPYRGVIEVRKRERGFIVISELSLEHYVTGIINNEVSSKWHVEALKTQAVISRTYALYQKERRAGELYHLTGTHMDQVYTGAGKEDAASRRAVKATRGQVLTFNGVPALTVFHSSAGGVTESSKNVWKDDYPYLRSVKSKYDKRAPNYGWVLSLTARSLGDKLKAAGHNIGVVKKVVIGRKTRTGRVVRIVIKGKKGRVVMTGEELRRALGYGFLKSTLFKVKKRRGVFVFTGRGSGHGVGLSQWGAKGMAEHGASYKKILKHYYKGTKLKKVY